MMQLSINSRAAKIAIGLAMGSCAIAAHADPFSLQGVCRLASITGTASAGGTCQLEYVLTDDFTGDPANVRKANIKVNNITVALYANDTANPAQYSAGAVSGVVVVACGANYQITAQIARVGSSVYENIGAVPLINCPPQK